MVMNQAEGRFSGIELEFMGQQDSLGRYPIHYHILGEDGQGSYIKGVSVHKSFNNALVVHLTDSVIVDDNVVYDINGMGVFIEEHGGKDSQITNNVIMSVHDDGRGDTAGIWIESTGNLFSGNHIAGVQGEGVQWDFAFDSNPENFSNNTITGVNNATASKLGTLGDLKNTPPTDFGQDEDIIGIQKLYVGWSNIGFWAQRDTGFEAKDVILVEVDKGTRLRKNQFLEDAVIVGDTGLYAGSTDRDVEGWQFYDGPATMNDITFHNFNDDDYAIHQTNAVEPMLSHSVNDVAFVNTPFENQIKLTGGNGILNYKTIGFVDVEGNMTGVAGAQLMPHFTKHGIGFYYGDNYEIINEWEALVNYDQRLGNFVIHDEPGASYKVQREDSSDRGFSRTWGEQGTVNHGFFMNGEVYDITFKDSSDEFEIQLLEMPYGSSVTYKFAGLDIATNFSQRQEFSRDGTTDIREVSSLEYLDNSDETAIYRDQANDVIYIRFVADAKIGWYNINPSITYDDQLLTGYFLEIDQRNASLVDLDNLTFDDPTGDITIVPYVGTEENDLFHGFTFNDEISGGAGDDELYGGLGDDSVSGGIGNDALYGNSGDDILNGQEGNDILTGNSGQDSLDGGSGNDILIGGAGTDSLTGGEGADRFVLDIDKSWGATSSFDTIQDLEVARDRIDLTEALENFDASQDDILNRVQLYSTLEKSILSVDAFDDGTFTELARIASSGFTLDDLIRTGTLDYGQEQQNSSPLAFDESYSSDQDIAISGNILTNDRDIDADTLNVTAGQFTTVKGGIIDLLSDGSFTYTHALGFTGEDYFNYTVDDGNGGSDVGRVDFTITPTGLNGDYNIVDEAGQVVSLIGDQTLSISEFDNSFTIEAIYEGEDGNFIGNDKVRSVEIQILSDDGIILSSAVINRGNYIFDSTNFQDFVFENDQTYTLKFDGYSKRRTNGDLLDSFESDIHFAFESKAPEVLSNPTFDLLEATELSFDSDVLLANIQDPDGDDLNIIYAGAPDHGNISMDENGIITYAPGTDFSGADSFEYLVQDVHGVTVSGLINLNVTPLETGIFGQSILSYDLTTANAPMVISSFDPDDHALSITSQNGNLDLAGLEALSSTNIDGDLFFDFGNNQSITIKNFTNYEDIRGYVQIDGNGFESLTLNAPDNDDITLQGRFGDDILTGRYGEDILYGDHGQDILEGSRGLDILYGGGEDDILYGGRHTDTLFGGSGADTFEFKLDTSFRFDANDIIKDFSLTEGDKIDVSDVLGDVNITADVIMNYISFVDIQGEGSAQLMIDTDGSGSQTGFRNIAIVENQTGLNAAQLLGSGNLIA
ncbi:MAG: cadherin-like domain-containing protein [Pseudomonadota bacterium]